MKINFILGRAGSGKTTHILEQMNLHSAPIINIVPEQYSLQAERDILNYIRPLGKQATDINVLSFKRLAYKVFAETGFKNKIMLDNVGLAMLLRRVMYDVKNNLNYYKDVKITHGFMQSLARTITELSQGGVVPADLDVIKDIDTAISHKTKDIQTIYQNFLDATQQDHISTEQALDILSERIMDSDFVASSHIFIDGFSSLTSQEYAILEELIRHGKSVTISLTVDEPNSIHLGTIKELKETDTFYETKLTAHNITDLAKKTGADITYTTLLENVRHANSKGLQFIEQNLFNLGTKFGQDENNEKSVTLSPYANSYEEVVAVATSIIQTIKEGEYTFSDISIVAPDTYHLPIKTIFKEYDIPFFLDTTTDILSHPLINTIISAVSVVVTNYDKDSVFSLLKSGLVDIETEAIDQLENYAIAYNITGYKWKLPQWHNAPDPVSETKATVVEILSNFEKCFEQKNIKDITTNIFMTMKKAGVFDKLQTKDDIAVYKKLVHALETIVNFLGEQHLAPAQYLQVLEAGLAETSLGKVPETLDGVTIANINRSRLPNIKILYVVGTNELQGKLPESLYTDAEKATINSFGANLITAVTRVFRDNFAIYSYFAKPSHSLHITYATNTIEGKLLAVSPLVSILKSKNIPAQSINFADHINKSASLKKLALGIHKYYQTNEIDQHNIDLHLWYQQNGYNIQKIEREAKGGTQPHLSEESIDMLYGSNIYTSVSRLEQYSRCPFSYYTTYNLQAKERKEYEIRSIDIGNILHEVIEKFTPHINSVTTKGEIATILNEIMDQIQYNTKDLFESHRAKYIIERIRKVAATSLWAMINHQQQGKFTLHDIEVGFGKDADIQSLVIEIDDKRKFVLNGRVDRIDIYDHNGKAFVKIIDYKSGSRDFDEKELNFGLQLQLIMYLNALMQHGKQYFNTSSTITPGGMFYFKINDPILDTDLAYQQDGDFLQAIEEKIITDFKMSGLLLNDTELVHAIQKDMQVTHAKINKDATLAKHNNTKDLEEFEQIIYKSNNVVSEIGKKIVSGKIAPHPFKKGEQTACDYCLYKPICNFDLKNKRDIYNFVN